MRRLLSAAVFFLASASLCYGGFSIDSDSLELLEKGEISKFKGNVRITGENFTINSETAESDRRAGFMTLEGDVDINYSSDTWRFSASCDTAKIDEHSEMIYLKGNTRSIYYTPQEEESTRVICYADEADIDYSANRRAFFKGNVRVEREGLRIFSQRAEYYNDEEFIEFTQNPYAYSVLDEAETRYSGEIISVYISENRITIEGDARARVRVDESEM